MKTKSLLPACLAFTALLAATFAQAATVFLTNTSGNASGLQDTGANDVTPLTLSSEDGGGTINLTNVSVYNGATAQTLGMSGVGMGVGNDKWGNGPQGWIFSFDQIVSFDGIGFNASGGNDEGVFIQSDAWIGAAVDDAGQNWTFDSTAGAFSVVGSNGPLFDFTSAGVSSIAAGTTINIEHNSGNGGSSMTQFTITPIPEPTTALIGGLGLLALLRRRR